MKISIAIATLFITAIVMAGCGPEQTIAPTPKNPSTATPVSTSVASTATTYIVDTFTPSQIPISPIPPLGLPEISVGKMKSPLMAFVQENGGCTLPCVLGLIPGSTEHDVAEAFVNYFDSASHQINRQNDDVDIHASFDSNGQGGMGILFWEDNKHVQVGIDYYLSGGKVANLILFGEAFLQGDNVATKIYGDPFFNTILSNFTLPHVLNTYGIPNQVLVRPSPPGIYSFDFVLVYPGKGFLVEYITKRVIESNGFTGCPTKPYNLQVSAWDPAQPFSLIEAARHFSSVDGISAYNIDQFKPIESVSSISVADFYKIFSITGSESCVQTQQRLWPTPTP